VKFVFAGHRIGLFFLLLCLHLTLWNMSSGLFYSWINSCQNCELAVSRTLWVWDQPVINSLPTQEKKNIYVDMLHILSVIQEYKPSIRWSETVCGCWCDCFRFV